MDAVNIVLDLEIIFYAVAAIVIGVGIWVRNRKK